MKFLLPLFLSLILSASCALAQYTTLPPVPQDGFVTLQQIMSDFTAHPNAASRKYSGLRITVYGRVGHLSKGDDMSSNPLIAYLQTTGMNTTPDVKCIFTPDGVPTGQGNLEISENHRQATIYHRNGNGELTRQTAFLSVGDMVAIRGTFSDFEVGDIILKDCRRVPKGKVDGLLAKHGVQ